MRLLRDGLIALVTGFLIAAVAASVNPHHLARILWIGAIGTFVALVVVLVADWKRAQIRRALLVLVARFPIAIRIERRRRVPRPANATPAERGLWDFRRDGERARDAMTAILGEQFKLDTQYSKMVERHTKRMVKANEKGSAIEHVYELGQDYAKDVDSHTEKAERLEARFRTERIRMIDNFGAWIAGQPAETDMSGFIAELREMGTITTGARESVTGFRDTVRDLRKQNISQPVNAAMERLVAVLDRQIENLAAIEQFCLNPTGGTAVASVTP